MDIFILNMLKCNVVIFIVFLVFVFVLYFIWLLILQAVYSFDILGVERCQKTKMQGPSIPQDLWAYNPIWA